MCKSLRLLFNSIDANEVLLTDRGVPISSTVQTAVKAKVDQTANSYLILSSNVQSNCSTINPPSPDGMTEVATLVHNSHRAGRIYRMTAQKAADEFYAQANVILEKAAGESVWRAKFRIDPWTDKPHMRIIITCVTICTHYVSKNVRTVEPGLTIMVKQFQKSTGRKIIIFQSPT